MNVDSIADYMEGLQHQIQPNKEPGFSAAVIQRGKMVYSFSYGLSCMENETPLTSNSLYYTASVSKQFTAFCILTLINEKKLKLSQDIRSILRETNQFPHKITVQNLLNHTSGIPDYFPFFACQLGHHVSDYFDNSHILEVINKLETLNFIPNDKFEYSNSNYILLAELVRKISGSPLPKYAKKMIFRPLGMKDTLYDDDRCRVVKNRVQSYSCENTHPKVYRSNLKNSCTVGDGGVLTSINDLAKWETELLKPQTLPREIAKGLAKCVKLSNGELNHYANGLERTRRENGDVLIYHGGGFEGLRTFVVRQPIKKLSVVYLSNNPTIEFSAREFI